MKAYDATGPGQLLSYDAFDDQRKLNFWLHTSRWTEKTAITCYGPLRKAVDLNAALLNPKWSAYMQGIYGVACMTTWANKCRYMNGDGHFTSKEDQKRVDTLQIYEDIRNAPEQYFPDRPSVQDVPTHQGGPLDQGRRNVRRPEPRKLVMPSARLGAFDDDDEDQNVSRPLKRPTFLFSVSSPLIRSLRLG